MSRNVHLTLLASAALAVALSVAANAEAQVPKGVAGGSYDSYGRTIDPSNNNIPKLDRFVRIIPNGLGGFRYVVRNGNNQIVESKLIVPKCLVSFDRGRNSYFQNFQTVPPTRGGIVEQVTFYFRINDPVGDYDVYFQAPGGPLRSEVLLRNGS